MIAALPLARRLVIALAFILLLAPFLAKTNRSPIIGIIEYGGTLEPFLRALRDCGYIEGQNIELAFRSAEGTSDQLADVAAELVRLEVDVLVTLGTPATLAASSFPGTLLQPPRGIAATLAGAFRS